MGNTLTPTPGDCLAACQENESCNFFTHFGGSGTCDFFDNCVEFSTDTCTDCVSGSANCRNTFCQVSGKVNIRLKL